MKPVSSDELAARVAAARERWSVPGMAVGVLRDGEVVTAAAGVRELGGDAAVTPDDVFRIASITKPFVAALVMTLVRDGLLDLDAQPAGFETDATMQQLLSHQGGLACEAAEPLHGLAPGELFSYSNAGFWLVGSAVADAAGTTFEEAMHDRVLEPLALEATGFEPQHPVPGHLQSSPGTDEHRLADVAYPRARRPSGGLWSSVEDLLRFASDQFEHDEARRPVSSGPGFEHGLGWFLLERGGRPAAEHAGSAAGYQSLLMLVPSERIAFAALTNSTRGSAAINDVAEGLGLGKRVYDGVALGPQELAAFTGRYEAPGIRTLVEAAGTNLRLTTSERDPFTREILEYPPVVGRPIAPRDFQVVNGEWRGEIFGFPRDGFLSHGVVSRLVA